MGKLEQVAVSVIIPVYNVEQFLVETIESVLSQTLQNLEIILVNDGSIDASVDICQRYAMSDARIQFIDQINQGVSVARNKGFGKAKGEYVYFLDSDDTIDPNFLEGSYQIAREHAYDLVVLGDVYCKRGPSFTAVPTCGLLIKREFLDFHSDVRFPVGIQPCEDGLFSHKLFALTSRVGKNPEAIYFYRKHENQNHVRINSETANVLKQIPLWLVDLLTFYTEHKFFDSKILHLARFIEHEPFEIRYLRIPFNETEKAGLFFLIKNFMQDHVLSRLTKEEKNSLSAPFVYFINADRFTDFDRFYPKYKESRQRRFMRALFWVRFIPITSIRRKRRQQIRTKFEDA